MSRHPGRIGHRSVARTAHDEAGARNGCLRPRIGLVVVALHSWAWTAPGVEPLAGQAPAPASEEDSRDGPMGHAFAGSTAGTDRRPRGSRMEGLHFDAGSWRLMAHGFATLAARRDPAPRGEEEVFHTSMLTAHARRPLAGGWLELQGMVSSEPALGPSGYPLLLQTGETADGLTPLVDRQHPHDLLGGLSASYRREVEPGAWAFLYVAPVGSPALGPVAFMHRASASANPVAPISHHFLDATHITHGVLTGGLSTGLIQAEVSWFNGREPDRDRWTPDPIVLNSWAARLTVTPGAEWAMQASFGDLTEPERLHPAIDVYRATLSVTHERRFGGGAWATTLAWGRNTKQETTMTLAEARARIPGPLLDHYLGVASLPPDADETLLLLFERREQSAVLVESSLTWRGLTGYGRYERARKDELFPPSDLRHSRLWTVSKLDVGLVAELSLGDLRTGVGASGSFHTLPEELDDAYGAAPRSWMVFAHVGL